MSSSWKGRPLASMDRRELSEALEEMSSMYARVLRERYEERNRAHAALCAQRRGFFAWFVCMLCLGHRWDPLRGGGSTLLFVCRRCGVAR